MNASQVYEAFETRYKGDPEYTLRRESLAEIIELRDEYYAEGLRRFALRKRVRDEMKQRHSGRKLDIILALLRIFTIVLFFI